MTYKEEITEKLRKSFPNHREAELDAFVQAIVVDSKTPQDANFSMKEYENCNYHTKLIYVVGKYSENYGDLVTDIDKYNDNKREEEEDKLKYFVNREEDLEKLTSATNSQLTIYKIEAPLGYGKTTLINDKLKYEAKNDKKDFHFYVDFGERDKFTFTLPEFIDNKLTKSIKGEYKELKEKYKDKIDYNEKDIKIEENKFVDIEYLGSLGLHKGEKRKIYLVFDSIEKINKEFESFVEYIKKNIDEYGKGELTYGLVVIISGRNINTIYLPNPIEELNLKPLNTTYIQAALEKYYDNNVTKKDVKKESIKTNKISEQLMNITGGHPGAILKIISEVIMKDSTISLRGLRSFPNSKDKIIEKYIKPIINTIIDEAVNMGFPGFKDSKVVEKIIKYVSVFSFINYDILSKFQSKILESAVLSEDEKKNFNDVGWNEFIDLLINIPLYEAKALDFYYDSITRRLFLNYFKNTEPKAYEEIFKIANDTMKELKDYSIKNGIRGEGVEKYLYGYVYLNEDKTESTQEIISQFAKEIKDYNNFEDVLINNYQKFKKDFV